MTPVLAEPPRRVEPQPSLSEHTVEPAPESVASQGTATFAISAPSISVSVAVINSAWLEPTLTQFESMLALPQGWDSYAGVPTSFESFRRAINFLGAYLGGDSLPPTVVPLSDGGVQLVWHDKGLDVEATFPTTDGAEIYVRDLETDVEHDVDLMAVEAVDILRETFQRLSA